MNVINGNDLIVYIGDKPIACSTGTQLNIESGDPPILAQAREYKFTVSGIMPLQLTYMEKLEMEWVHTIRLPRKTKKQRRKLIKRAVIAEFHRQRVMDYLDTI